MDEKAELRHHYRPQDRRAPTPAPIMRARRRSRPALLVLAVLAVGAYLVYSLQLLSAPVPAPGPAGREDAPPGARTKADDGSDARAGGKLVPLEAHIMSKCPDARDCLRRLVLPAMQRIHDKVNFTLSYIGTPTENDGVKCKHGPEECMGNIIELCATRLYPDPKQYLGFVMCLSRDYEDIPDRTLIEDCALEHALDFAALNDCASKDDGGYGVGMLRDSVRRSEDAGVTKSCTVRLDEKIYCVRDDGEWTICPGGPGVNDLVIAVEKLYRSS